MQLRKLARAQRALCRKQANSRNRTKARRRVARLHQKVHHQRTDFLHKASVDLVRRFDLVVLENLSIRGLAKTKLATSVHDASWRMFRQLIEYKTDRQNKYMITVDRFYPSSRICSVCKRINSGLTLAEQIWTCTCGVAHDRDLNAATNIAAEGLRLFVEHVAAGYAETQNACGEPISPIKTIGPTR
jgi:putative transposase